MFKREWQRFMRKPAGIAAGIACAFCVVALGAGTIGNPPEDQMKRGQEIYSRTCLPCHQQDGTGYPGLFPPLAKSDFFMDDKARAISVVVNGFTGPLTVNGEQYDNVMPPWGGQLTDAEIADVMTFERNSWGNHGAAVTVEEIAKARGESKPK